MLIQAILVGLVAMCVTFEWALGTCLASRPIVTGVLIGLVMGDLETGIIVGATLEMVFIGSVTIGAAVPPVVEAVFEETNPVAESHNGMGQARWVAQPFVQSPSGQ